MSHDDSISLNKYISMSGMCSRREADNLIEHGLVTINGTVAHKGNRVFPDDKVVVDGLRITVKSRPKTVYIALNKPPGITCTTDTSDKSNIISFVNYKERIFPIGRLDKASSGLILLTNDGDIVNKILRYENRKEKEYIVQVHREITSDFIRRMAGGLPILGTRTKKCKTEQIDKFTFRITLTQGLNRQIRRMCEYLGYRAVSLFRVRIMHIKLDGLAEGSWRYLTDKELSTLKENLV